MPWVSDDNAALLTDLYQLTMAASYFAHDRHETATFDLFVRGLPEHRNFLVAAGLDDALHYLESLRFDADALAWLDSLGMFRPGFLDYLGGLRFSGEVRAVAEGELVFGNEPLLTVTAPLIEAQLVETFLLNCINFQTMVASKAARVTLASGPGRSWADFSPRRDHGGDAALKAARAAWIAGASSTSNVLAGRMWGIPLGGTMAHSYIMSFATEEEAFRAYAADFPGAATMLLDTYDTVEAARTVVKLVGDGVPIQAVRLDSGDLLVLSQQVRAVLDEGGCPDVRIVASGDLDEYRVTELLEAGAPIDAFGIGTRLGTSYDVPALSGVYKLVDIDGRAVRKRSKEKQTLPGMKQVWRIEQEGIPCHDVIALRDETPPDDARAMLVPVMQAGARLPDLPTLADARATCARSLAMLPASLRTFGEAEPPYCVELSAGLQALVRELE